MLNCVLKEMVQTDVEIDSCLLHYSAFKSKKGVVDSYRFVSMHKPSRPKSAKGRSRTSRNIQESSTTGDSSKNFATSLSKSSSHSTITSAFVNSHAPCPSSGVTASTETTNGSSPATLFPEITRPTSSLSRYRILPSISDNDITDAGGSAWYQNVTENLDGRISEMELLTEQAQQMILDSSTQSFPHRPTPPTSASKRKVLQSSPVSQHKRQRTYQTRSIFGTARNSVPISKDPGKPRVPRQPGPNEHRLLIALKLPDGSRVERFFHPDARLIGVLAFAHSQYPILPISQCNLYRMDVVPKKLLSDTTLSLNDVGIKNRTVLYVEEVDDD